MKNGINNNGRKVYDLGAIMKRAWSLRKAAAVEIGCKASEILMSDCLRIAWAEAEAVHAEANAEAVIAEWAATPAEKQVEWLQRCVVRASRDVIGYSVEDHYHQFYERSAWGLHGHHFDEYVNQAWLCLAASFDRMPRTNERRAAKGLRPLSLRSAVYNAAKAAVMKIWADDKKHGATEQDPEIVNDNGEIASYIETQIADTNADADTETSAVVAADLERFKAGRDEIDVQIIESLQENYTERQIATAIQETLGIKISNVAVHKRIVKIRAALQAAGIA